MTFQASRQPPLSGNKCVQHQDWMRLALAQAQLAEQSGEVPIGAVLVKDNQLIATGFNQPIATHDPSAHAEIIALRQAGQHLANYRLPDCTLYVTIEPCAMCAAALVHARLAEVVFGAFDEKAGACGSVMNLVQHNALNHRMAITAGVLAEECRELLRQFFQRRRIRT